jgi:hypothetical protein
LFRYCGNPLEQCRKLAGTCFDRIEFATVLTARVPIVSTALRIEVNQGRTQLTPRRTYSHMHGKRRFSTAAFLGKDCKGFHASTPF